MTSSQRTIVGSALVAAVLCLIWLAFLWSPKPEPLPEASEPDDGAQALVAPQPAAPSPPPTAAVTVPQPAAAPVPAQPAAEPERIPTPHVMSLDQLRPPEPYGPVAEYKKRYASESRAADSSANEQMFRKRLDVPNIPPGLVQDVSCRRSVCKLELSWRPDRRLGFVVTVESSKVLYKQRVAVEPGTREDDGSYLTNLYIVLH